MWPKVIAGRSYEVGPMEVLPLAVTSRCTACDSQYGASAQQLDVPLVTRDGEVLEKFPETAAHPSTFLNRRD